jgi:hypothetical protein
MKISVMRGALATVLLLSTAAVSTAAFAAPSGPLVPKLTQKGPKAIIDVLAPDSFVTPNAPFVPSVSPLTVGVNFTGSTDRTTRALGIGLIPPDTMGAVGTTQYVQLLNGSFAVYNKADGSLAQARKTDSAFWTAAGLANTGGDPRVLFDARANRWIAIGFGSTNDKLNVAVSATADATGVWKASSFVGFTNPFNPALGSTADFPTLAVSGNSVIIATNNFAPATNGGANSFRGTTINVLKLSDLYAPTAPGVGPNLSSLKQFDTPIINDITADRGFAAQGVNRIGGDSTATVVSASLFFNDTVTFKITNAGKANATLTDQNYLSDFGGQNYASNGKARQPDLGNTGSARVVDTSDDRIASNAWEVHGKIYFVNTVTAVGTDNTVVRVTVYDKATNNVLSTTDITDASGNFDFYMGSIAVNASGQVLVGYNRSGNASTGASGNISIFARSFNTNLDGTLSQTGDQLLRQSTVDSYHNGSAFGAAPVGRQRWGDYSAVSVDPTNKQSFWVVAQFADEFQIPGSGFGRWGTNITQLSLAAVPEPGSWALMIVGFGVVGGTLRRKRMTLATA